MRGTRLWFLVALIALLASGMIAAGCGDDGGDKGGGRQAPKPKAPLSGELAGWNRAVAAQSCQQYVPLLVTAVRNPQARPGGPPVGDECRVIGPAIRQVRGVSLRKAKQFGTAGIAEGPGPRRGRFSTYPAIFLVDWDGRYRFLTVGPADPQIGTKPKAGTDYQATADAFVKAVRDKNCTQFLKYVMPNAAFFRGVRSPRDACQVVFRGKNLAPQLVADKEAKPEKLGETLDLGFFGIATKRNYYTLLIQTKPVAGIPPQLRAKYRGKPNALVSDYFSAYRPVG